MRTYSLDCTLARAEAELVASPARADGICPEYVWMALAKKTELDGTSERVLVSGDAKVAGSLETVLRLLVEWFASRKPATTHVRRSLRSSLGLGPGARIGDAGQKRVLGGPKPRQQEV